MPVAFFSVEENRKSFLYLIAPSFNVIIYRYDNKAKIIRNNNNIGIIISKWIIFNNTENNICTSIYFWQSVSWNKAIKTAQHHNSLISTHNILINILMSIYREKLEYQSKISYHFAIKFWVITFIQVLIYFIFIQK